MSVIGIIRRRSNEISCVALQHFDASCVLEGVSEWVTHIFIQISIKMAVSVVTVGPLLEPVSGFILAPHTSTCTVKPTQLPEAWLHDQSCMLSPWLVEAAVTGSTCHTEMQEPVELCCGPEPMLGEAAVLFVCTQCHHSQSRAECPRGAGLTKLYDVGSHDLSRTPWMTRWTSLGRIAQKGIADIAYKYSNWVFSLGLCPAVSPRLGSVYKRLEKLMQMIDKQHA